MPPLRFAMVCASNMNRSMEAHKVLKEHDFEVESFGVGRSVKLPGPSKEQPNSYPFGTPYVAIYDDLVAKDSELYARTGLLDMAHRNLGIKHAPERWQNCKDEFDVAITFEERVMDQLVADMGQREQHGGKMLLVVNLEVKDTTNEAAVAAPQALKLCQMLEGSEDWEDDVDDIMRRFEGETSRKPLYTICFY